MPDASTATFLFYDASGGYSHIAEAVAPHAKRVLYYTYCQPAFPRVRDMLPGMGVEGVERVTDFFDALPDADVVCFLDVGMVGLQKYLRDQDVPVFGAGIGSYLEQDRWKLKQVLAECGLPVGDCRMVIGIDALAAVLEKQDDLYVKASLVRGDVESFHHLNACATQAWLDDLRTRLGPYQSRMPFIVEAPIDGHAVEVGMDGFLVNGELLEPCGWGYEDKDAGYIGTILPVPDRLRECYEKLQPLLTEIRYCGPFCIEARITEEAAYVIDFTARFGSPPSEAQAIGITNLADVIYEGAHGRPVEPEYAAPYQAQLVLGSEWSEEHPLGLEIEQPERVALHGHCRFDGADYVVSQAEIKEMGGAVGLGRTVAEAVTECFAVADGVKGYQVHVDTAAFGRIMECIKEGETLGLPWGRVSASRAA